MNDVTVDRLRVSCCDVTQFHRSPPRPQHIAAHLRHTVRQSLRGLLATLLIAPALAATTLPAAAEGLSLGRYVGTADVFVNDGLGDGHDRWRSMGYSYSRLYEDSFFGNITELRLRAEIISPYTPGRQAMDRDYANAIGLGAYTIGKSGALGYRLGGEMLITGDQTHLRDIQRGFHKIFGGGNGYGQTGTDYYRLEDGVHGLVQGEVWSSLGAPQVWEVRPYASAKAGYETAATAGVDVILGPAAHNPYWTRDEITGTPIAVDGQNNHGFSWIVGADVTQLKDSIYFADHSDVRPEKTRTRARAGVQWRSDPFSVFFGQAWLSKEFEGQIEAQRLGVLAIDFTF